MLASPLIQFIVVALVCALFLWAITKFGTLDADVLNFIKIALLVVLSIMLLNVILMMLFGHAIPFYLGGGGS